MRQEFSAQQGLLELVFTFVSLGFLLYLTPLGSPHFETVTRIISVVALLYIIFRLFTQKNTGERWGLPFCAPFRGDRSINELSEDIFGCLLLGWFFLAGALPMLFLKMIAPLPITIDPATYLVWCVVQDFVFFALIFRNLEDWINPLYAGATTALVFGLSHYPYLLFIVVTTLSGAVWAYAFFRTRSLSLIVLSHWVMGVVYLS